MFSALQHQIGDVSSPAELASNSFEMDAISEEVSFYGKELLGRGFVTTKDLQIGWTIIGFSALQLMCGVLVLWILIHMQMFHNAFGMFCAARTIVEMMSSLLHLSYSGPMTVTQVNAITPIIPMIVGFVAYSLMGISCALHVQLTLNRFVAVYFPLSYASVFSKRNCKYIVAMDVIMMMGLASLFYLVPCNVMGYSPSYHGFIILACRNGSDRPFPIGTVLNFICQYALCIGAISIDCLTLFKIAMIDRKKGKLKDTKYNRNVRFFAQSAFQNVPMLLNVVFLSISNYSTADNVQVHRVLNFLLARFADFINAVAIIMFNPEAYQFLWENIKKKRIRPSVISNEFATTPQTTHLVSV
ncbi:hypothetical protein L596_020554 [Steinernema carpocapsae]|uniref:7TM GPCR serpentine receptor class x (Srx) domain-containing protein n=1 Tax=Steinernema carpocapsae TaxID=34508 RepID=A0A4U5MU30_STECR|nr:hypothetical protein L596_020554 [Steinernema carpocapsae]